MGNTSTKEARPPFPHPARHGRSSGTIETVHHQSSPYAHAGGASRQHRGSRPDLSFLGISPSEQNVTHVEPRRETKQEREARRREKERAARLKERERSMKEEHVDGGFLVTQGVYVGTEDFSKPVVRQLIIERKIAPFWKGLNDFSESWVEHQIIAAVRGMPIPAADEIPPELEYKLTPKPQVEAPTPEQSLNNLTVPMGSRSQSFNSDSSRPTSPFPRSSAPSPPGSHLFRGRAKTLASLSLKSSPSPDMSPREIKLPQDPFVNGQPIEAYLYKDGSECPICFLYYPPYLNRTRCCDQPICSECFVQIKRPDPHPPEHEPRDANTPPPANEQQEPRPEEILVSEPAACPFCVQPEFGVTYAPPPFRRGLAYASASPRHPLAAASSAASSSSSVAIPSSNNLSVSAARRRATSLSADAPGVITTDRVRPDWAHKLATARAHAIRRSAAATALHAAAYLMNNNEQRPAGSGPRRMLRRVAIAGIDSPTSGSSSPHISNLAQQAIEQRAPGVDRENDSGAESPHLVPPRASSRRDNIQQMEDLMLMEAIRLSLIAEEERRIKAEKEAKKEAKKREKEAKKAEKRFRRGNLSSSNNISTASLNTGFSSPAPKEGESVSSRALASKLQTNDKGKGVDRSSPAPFQPESTSKPESPAPSPTTSAKVVEDERSISPLPPPSSAELTRRLHFRRLSSASSSNSSLVESSLGDQIGSASPHTGSNPGIEPMLNFQSLAGVIDDEDKDKDKPQQETATAGSGQGRDESPSPVCDCGGGTGATELVASRKTEDIDIKEARANHTELSPTPNPVGASS